MPRRLTGTAQSQEQRGFRIETADFFVITGGKSWSGTPGCNEIERFLQL
jgi:hypothetical protein